MVAPEASSVKRASPPATKRKDAEEPPAKATCYGCSSLRKRLSDAEAEIEELLETVAASQAAEIERDRLAKDCDELRNLCDGLIAENGELRQTAAAAATSADETKSSGEEDEASAGESEMSSEEEDA